MWDKEISDCLDDLLDNPNLTDWEGDFVEDMYSLREKNKSLNKTQRDKLLEIYDERELGRQQK